MPPSGLLLGGPYHVLDTQHFPLNFFLTTPRRFYSHFMETKSEFEEVKKFSVILKNKHQLPSLKKKKERKFPIVLLIGAEGADRACAQPE